MPEPPRGPTVERRVVSVLFADLVGFTALSERLDPEDVAAIQDAYFATVRATVERYGGVLEKFIGDAAMAVFGVPRARDDDAERAVRAGLAIINAVGELGARIGLTDHVLQLRAGVNSGEVAHAIDGPDAGRVTGDTVNLAARLQAAAQPGSVLLGPLTAVLVEEPIELGPMNSIELKGKAEPVQVREATRLRISPSRDEMLGSLRAPTLGRDEELALLVRRAVEMAAASLAGLTLIVAPPGVGKSRLLAELALRADVAGSRVLRARIRPHAVAPYEAVAELLSGALEAARGSSEDAAGALRSALASAGTDPGRAGVVVREAMALLAPAAVEARAVEGSGLADEREARFAAWTEALDALAHAAPSVWLVEDVHWAGGDLLVFLHQAGRAPTIAGRLVVATARPSILESAPDWCSTADLLDLPALEATDAAALLRALVGDVLQEPLVASIAERSDGNPLFIEELVRTWISVGTLVQEDGRWRLAVDFDQVALPLSVQAIYAAQLDDLPAEARMVARRASVAGRRFPIAAMRPLDLEEWSDGLVALRRRGFVIGPQPDVISGDVYAYRHALLRDAGYASLARAERARLHVALARWLEAGAGERADQLAASIGAHYAAALESLPTLDGSGNGLDRDALQVAAADWLERGARTSLRLAAHEAGLRLLEHSIRLTPAAAVLDLARRRLRRGEVMAETADLQIATEEMAGALAAYESALRDGSSGARTGFARAAHSLASAYMQQTEFQRAEDLTRNALGTLAGFGTGSGPDPGVGRLMALHAWALGALGRKDGVAAEIRDATEIVRAAGDLSAELDVLMRRIAVRGEIGDLEHDSDESRELTELEALARRLGRWSQASAAMRRRGMNAADESPAAGMAVLREARQLAQAHGLTEEIGWCDLWLAECAFVSGDWDEAITTCEGALATAERYEYARLRFRTWMVLMPMIAARGDDGRAQRFAATWDGSWQPLPPEVSPYAAVLIRASGLWIGQARGVTGDPPVDELAPITQHAHSNPHFVAALETLAQAWLHAGKGELAAMVRDHLVGQAVDDATNLMRCSAELIASWLALASGDEAAVKAAAGRAISAARSLGAAWWLARAIRALEAVGAATPELLAEAESCEERMGISRAPAG